MYDFLWGIIYVWSFHIWCHIETVEYFLNFENFWNFDAWQTFSLEVSLEVVYAI